MKYKTYIFSSRLSVEAAIARLGDLLAQAQVQYRIEGLSVSSTHIPIVLTSFQRAMYSNRNWLGLNPFPLITGVDVQCHPDKSGFSKVVVRVNRARAFFLMGFQVWCVSLASLAMPTLAGALLVIAAAIPLAWVITVGAVGKLIQKEITYSLKA